MLQNLLKTLSKDQKPIWPTHLGALVFAYNDMPHSTTEVLTVSIKVWLKGSNTLQ